MYYLTIYKQNIKITSNPGLLGLRKGPSCFNQQGQVVAMESSHYTSKVGMSS